MSLYREVGFAASTFLVIGNIIGIGIFTTSGLVAQEIGQSFWLIGVWLLGGVLALIGAVCYSRLGVRFPSAGGEYAFLKPTFGPLPAFLSGWASLFIGFTAPIAASALGLAHYAGAYLPENLEGDPLVIRVIAISALIAVSALLSFGLKTGNRLHSGVTLLNFLLVLGFAVIALSRAPATERLTPILNDSLISVGLPDLASAVILVMFTYSGWNAAAYIAEEIKSPDRNIPASLVFGTVAVLVLYILINLAYLAAAPLEALQGEVAVAEIAAAHVFGTVGRSLVNVLILFSILSSLTAMSIAGPRVYFAMARDRLFPSWLSDVHPEKKVPLRAIWFQTAIATLFVAVGNLYQILLYSGFILILFSTLTVATLFMISRARILPAFFILVNALVLINATFSNPFEALAGLLTVAAGLPVYFFYRARNGEEFSGAIAKESDFNGNQEPAEPPRS